MRGKQRPTIFERYECDEAPTLLKQIIAIRDGWKLQQITSDIHRKEEGVRWQVS